MWEAAANRGFSDREAYEGVQKSNKNKFERKKKKYQTQTNKVQDRVWVEACRN